MGDVLEVLLIAAVINAAIFVFSGNPSVFDLWHANAVSALQGKCSHPAKSGD